MLDLKDADSLNNLFDNIKNRDMESLKFQDFISSWLFADKLEVRGQRSEMSFSSYQGLKHLYKFFTWHNNAKFPHYFPSDLMSELVETSIKNDFAVFSAYEIAIRPELVEKIAIYNSQDYLYQRAYVVPDRNITKVLLDFGAGHGRLANLSFFSPYKSQRLSKMFSVDAIKSTYFTQLAYYRGLGLSVWEYFEHPENDVSRSMIEKALFSFDIIHLPTWRIDLIPDGSIDMVSAIQVLKEVPGKLINYALPQFYRVLKKSGAIYIRDHIQFHNPNHMPIDLLLKANGFGIEFSPQLKDRDDIHGVPRIWRKIDPDLFV